MNYKTGYCFTSHELYEKFKHDNVEMPKSYHLNGGMDTLQESFGSILSHFLELVVLDIIENNSTFVLPLFGNREACIYVKVFDGEQFQKLYSKGKFCGIDFLSSEFKGYQLFLQYTTSTGEIREKPIYISHNVRDIFYNHINNGKKYY